MRILITGGMGFIGGNLAVALSNVSDQITLASREALEPPQWLPTAKMIQIDWKDTQSISQMCNGIDVVVHTAGMNAQDCQNNPEDALIFNGHATEKLVKAATNNGVKRFIYLSTAHVYSNPLAGNFTEDSATSNNHPYAISHRIGEEAVLEMQNLNIIEAVVIRLSNVYGKPTHVEANCWDLLINEICRKIFINHEIVLRTNGSQQRDFITMSDTIGVIRRLVHELNFRGIPAILNLGSYSSKSVLEITNLISKRAELMLGFEVPVQRVVKPETPSIQTLRYGSNFKQIFEKEIRNDYEAEIDSLLEYCQNEFNLGLK